MTDGAVTQATPATLQNEEDEENPALIMEELQQLIQQPLSQVHLMPQTMVIKPF
jgi:hypothetical protein